MQHRLSKTAGTLKRSVMRDLIALISRPGVLSFATGLPGDENLPTKEIRECLDAVLQRDGARALQYGPPFGPLKELIAQHMGSCGVTCRSDDIFITNGNQQGLELCARLFLDGGESVAVEEYTFTGVLQAIQGHGANPVAIPVDLRDGMDIASLKEIAARTHPRMIITIPDFNNPMGVSMQASARADLAQFAAQAEIPVIEDAPYGPLRFMGKALPAIKSFDEGNAVIYLGSFSKMISPALRLGWMVAPQELIPRLTVLRESLDLESSQLLSRTVAEFLSRGYLQAHLDNLNRSNRHKRDVMITALEADMKDIAQWSLPEGGLFLWLTLPQTFDTQKLLEKTLAQNLAFVPGFAFSATPGAGRNTMRLNFSNAPLEKIAGGIKILAKVIRETLAY